MSGRLMTDLSATLPPLRITRVGFHALRAPTGDGVAMSFAPLRQRATALVIVETDDGSTGVGESWVNHPVAPRHGVVDLPARPGLGMELTETVSRLATPAGRLEGMS